MVARGHQVHCTAPDIREEVRTQLEAIGATCESVPLQRTGSSGASDLKYFRALRAIIRARRPDLVLGYTIKPNIWGSLAAKSVGVQSASLVTGLGFAFIARGGGAGRRVVQALARRLYARATAANRVVIFQNGDDRDDFVAAG